MVEPDLERRTRIVGLAASIHAQRADDFGGRPGAASDFKELRWLPAADSDSREPRRLPAADTESKEPRRPRTATAP